MNFLKTTFLGGIVFLIPIAVVVVILGKVLGVMVKLTAPLADLLPLDTFAGVAVVNLLAVIVIVLICFVAGLISKSRFTSRLVESLDSGLLQFVPGYAFFKGLTGEMAGKSEETQLAPVVVRFDESWQIAFRVETLADRRVVLFLPGAPDAKSGSIQIVEEERVQPLNQTMSATVRHLKALGRESSKFFSAEDRDAKGKTNGQR
jgi:uncharacterized membrane protein